MHNAIPQHRSLMPTSALRPVWGFGVRRYTSTGS